MPDDAPVMSTVRPLTALVQRGRQHTAGARDPLPEGAQRTNAPQRRYRLMFGGAIAADRITASGLTVAAGRPGPRR